ncbi:hypothetical protein [Bacillus rubiinfantis]|uniref:hypothetical protein n=1 Tax=Bacillus rubiinfantis TaxID=1499680 RepID=UPI0006946327|nr:hypothetical protein [Bacillus rubiinfantis]
MFKVMVYHFIIGLFVFVNSDTGVTKTVTDENLDSVSQNHKIEMINVYQPQTNQEVFPSLAVQHKVSGRDVFVECIVTGITFRTEAVGKEKTGKLIITIDGKRTYDVASAAFIIKNLEPGKHKIKLEVVSLKNVPYGLHKAFMVNIVK